MWRPTPLIAKTNLIGFVGRFIIFIVYTTPGIAQDETVATGEPVFKLQSGTIFYIVFNFRIFVFETVVKIRDGHPVLLAKLISKSRIHCVPGILIPGTSYPGILRILFQRFLRPIISVHYVPG
jgi:hypothetical protein